MIAVNAVIVRRIQRVLPGDEGASLARIYVWTLALRFVLALFLNAYSSQSGFAAMFWGDSSTYDDGGLAAQLQWEGEGLVNPYYSGKVSGWGFFYLVAAIYWVFGHNQLLAQLVNGTIGALTVIVIYAIAKDLFDVEVAQWTARFMAFFPADGLLVGGHLQGPRDHVLHRRVHVRGASSSTPSSPRATSSSSWAPASPS